MSMLQLVQKNMTKRVTNMKEKDKIKRKLGKCQYCGKIKPLRYKNACDSCYMKLYRAKKKEEKKIIRSILWITFGTVVAVSIFILWFVIKLIKN
jgi:uncharacterized paraquat-inducible protein A